MPLAPDRETGTAPSKPARPGASSTPILDEIRSLVAAQPVRQPTTVKQAQGGIFNPTVPLNTSHVGQDDFYANLLGSVFADTPIRGNWETWNGVGYAPTNGRRESGLLAHTESGTINENGYQHATDDWLDGQTDGNVFGDRTGDFTQTGNSRGGLGLLGGGARDSREPRNPAIQPWGPDRATTLAQAKIDRAQSELLDGKDKPTGMELLQAGSMNVMEELGMKAGALTTVPEVEAATETQRLNETPSVKADILAQLREEALAKGVRGKGVQAYIQQRTGMPGSEGYMSEDQVQLEESVADQQERRDRTQRMALNLGGGRKRTEALTSEEYAALSPKQKAAVDLNTLLVTAIREDLKGKQSSTAGGKEYDAAVADMFGEKGAADATYAPTTMRVLEDIGFNADGARLNDVLKLKVGLNAEDIADLKPSPRSGGPDAGLTTGASMRDDLTEALVTSFRQQRKDPQRGAALLETQRDVLNTRENLDFGSPANNQFVEQVYEFLAKPENKGKMQETMALAKTTLSEEHWPIFLAFLDARSREALQYDRPLGMDGEADYMRPKRFRNRLGL